MRITYIREGQYNSGGIERVVTQKANWMARQSGYQITILTFAQNDSEKDYFPLDNHVNRVKIHPSSENFKKDLSKKLSKWLKDNPQDICISTYGREFNILPTLKDGSQKLVEFHFCYDINELWAANVSTSVISKIFGKLRTYRMVRTAKKYDKIVVLTEADRKKWNNPKVCVIPNPITINSTSVSSCTSKRIIAIGRMDPQKGFDYLIDAWSLIEKRYPDWNLDIYGSGDRTPYLSRIYNKKLKNICIHPPVMDVCSELINSSIFVLSSRYEGFPLVICEAMRCGLPIVSFDCPTGPAELIEDGKNGYVIPKVGDVRAMAKCITTLIENAFQRYQFGTVSRNLSFKYELANIMKLWIEVFEILSFSETKCYKIK